MKTADKEALIGLGLSARLANGLELIKGSTVWLKTDPKKELGIVALVNGGRYFVRWSNGRTWVYPSADLVLGITEARAKELGAI